MASLQSRAGTGREPDGHSKPLRRVRTVRMQNPMGELKRRATESDITSGAALWGSKELRMPQRSASSREPGLGRAPPQQASTPPKRAPRKSCYPYASFIGEDLSMETAAASLVRSRSQTSLARPTAASRPLYPQASFVGEAQPMKAAAAQQKAPESRLRPTPRAPPKPRSPRPRTAMYPAASFVGEDKVVRAAAATNGIARSKSDGPSRATGRRRARRLVTTMSPDDTFVWDERRMRQGPDADLDEASESDVDEGFVRSASPSLPMHTPETISSAGDRAGATKLRPIRPAPKAYLPHPRVRAPRLPLRPASALVVDVNKIIEDARSAIISKEPAPGVTEEGAQGEVLSSNFDTARPLELSVLASPPSRKPSRAFTFESVKSVRTGTVGDPVEPADRPRSSSVVSSTFQTGADADLEKGMPPPPSSSSSRRRPVGLRGGGITAGPSSDQEKAKKGPAAWGWLMWTLLALALLAIIVVVIVVPVVTTAEKERRAWFNQYPNSTALNYSLEDTCEQQQQQACVS